MAEPAMRMARRRSQPIIPRTLNELGNILMEGTTFFCHGNILGAKVTDANGSAIILFCRTLTDSIAGGVQELHCDGTFKVVPSVPSSRQLFTLHGIKQNTVRYTLKFMHKARYIQYFFILIYLFLLLFFSRCL